MSCYVETTHADATKRTGVWVKMDKIDKDATTSIDIATSDNQAGSCVSWLYDTDQTNAFKVGVVSLCQKYFSDPGWANNGCVICTDPEAKYMSPGLAFPDTKCTPPTPATLRFLQTPTPTPTTTPTTTPTSAPASNSTTPIPTPEVDNSVITSIITADGKISFTICAVPTPICSSDAVTGKTYNDFFNAFKNELDTKDEILKYFSDAKLNTLVVSTYSDTTAPVITVDTLKLSEITSSNDGIVTFKATFTTNVKCFYQVSTTASASPPTFDSLMNCDNLCGNFRTGAVGVSVSTETFKKPLTANTAYNIFVGCTNDIPFSNKKSAVINGGTFTSQADPTPAPTPSPANNSTNTITCEGTQKLVDGKCVGSGFINISLGIMMLIALIFF